MASRTPREQTSDAVSDDAGSAQAAPREAFIPGQSDTSSPSAPPAAPPREIPEQRQQPDAGSVVEQQDEAAAAPSPSRPLTERDRAVLTFEKQYWKYSGAKEQAIRDRFDLSATRYYQMLNALLDRPEAQEFEPVLVKRLRRQRAARRRSRAGRTLSDR